jgi:hypothetical protein
VQASPVRSAVSNSKQLDPATLYAGN